MAFPDINGQTLVTLTQTNLGGLANAVTGDQLLSFINEGKDEVWALLKELKEGFFIQPSQATDNTKTSYFAPLVTNVREYTLPNDLRDIQFIEVTGPSGYERIKFTRRAITHPEFRNSRTSSTAFASQGNTVPLTGIGEYLYDVVGKNTLILAQYPEVAFTLIIWYVRVLPEITLSGVVDEIIYPFSKKIADFAVMKVMLLKDAAAWTTWKAQWRDDVVTLIQGADRYSADPVYAEDFVG